MASAAAQLGDNPAAERNLQEAADSSDGNLASLGKFGLASVYADEKKDEQAVGLYKQLIDKPTLLVSKVTAQFELANFYESRNRPDEARNLFMQIQKENPSSQASSLAQQRLAGKK